MSTELTETWAQGDQEACHVKEVCGHCQETQSVEATVQEERRSKTRHHGVASCQDMGGASRLNVVIAIDGGLSEGALESTLIVVGRWRT